MDGGTVDQLVKEGMVVPVVVPVVVKEQVHHPRRFRR